MKASCEFARVQTIRADELRFADVGALEPQEVGFIGHCTCGYQTIVRYSEVAAQAAVLEHVLGPDSLASPGAPSSSGSTSRAVAPTQPWPAARDAHSKVAS